MSQVKTNNVTLAAARESATLGTLPSPAEWFTLEPNDITGFGATVTTVARNPISKNRQARKGTTTDVDSGVTFEGDLTMEHLLGFIEGFMFAQANGPIAWADDAHESFAVSSCDVDSYTVEDASTTLIVGDLVYSRGWLTSANNGVKTVNGVPSATDVPVAETLVIETAPQKARLEVCGFAFVTGDLGPVVSGTTATITASAAELDNKSLTVGQYVKFAGWAGTAANNGYARIKSIANKIITLDKAEGFATEAATGLDVIMYFGKFIRNVDVDDADYIERSFQFELTAPDLVAVGTPGYEYAEGNLCNEMGFNLPLADKAGLSFGFIGTNTPVPTSTRQTDAGDALDPGQVVAFNTSADIAQLRVQQTDETEITSYFKELTLTLGNGITPEKVLGTVGAAFMNVGNFDVTFESKIVYTDLAIPTAIRTNETLTMNFILKNEDGAMMVDLPSLTMGDGAKEFEVGSSVKLNTPGVAFEDTTLGTSVSFSLFPYIP